MTSIDLAWIVVADLDKAVKFFVEIVGLELISIEKKFGWAELQGKDGGALLGIAQMSGHSPINPGNNAVVTISVENIDQAIAEMVKKGGKIIGELCVIPNHVKLQLFSDNDGNYFQLTQVLSK